MYHNAINQPLIDMYTMELTDRLRELRGDRTYREIADRAGVSPQAVQKWEKTGHVARKSAEAYDDALGAGGEVLNMLGYTAVNGASVTTIEEKVDRILGLVQEIADNQRLRRLEREETPKEMPRPVLRKR